MVKPQDCRTLLVVDDEPETLRGYQEFLLPEAPRASRRSSRDVEHVPPASAPATAEAPYRLLSAQSGEQAVELMRAEMQRGGRVAAGFFDVKLGLGMDGLQTISALRALDPSLYCVVVTAYHDRSVDEIQRIFGAEAQDQWDYLNKPFTHGEIVQKARQMVSSWNRKRELAWLTEQLIRSERLAAVGQVARGVGHEFGNILMRILGKADLALLEKDPTRVRAHLEVVLSAAERAGVIVRNLQSFAKVDPKLTLASPVQSLDQCLSLVSQELTKGSIELVRGPMTDTLCRIDVGAIAQIFLNLVINAIHAMPSGGRLSVSIDDASRPDWLACRVRDTGVGIAPEVLPRIFEFAFTTKGDRGSGLGLAISQELARAHGGEITVQTQPGAGSEFVLWLPRAVGVG